MVPFFPGQGVISANAFEVKGSSFCMSETVGALKFLWHVTMPKSISQKELAEGQKLGE